jgi:REP element-mobilizing transposase RayT
MDQETTAGYRALRKGRHSAPGGVYFITTVTDRRVPWFGDWELATIAARSLLTADDRYGTRTFCWVVMPDHIHWLVQAGELPLEKSVSRLKGSTARMLNMEIGRTGRFWFPGFHDHGLRKPERLRQVARYIVANPLRAGLVSRIGDYPFWNAAWL